MLHRLFRIMPLAGSLWFACHSFVLADAGYRLNPGDVLNIKVWQEENLHADVVVQPDGTVSFPLAGVLSASGKTIEEFTLQIKKKLDQYIPSAEVNVRVVAAEGNLIYVTGEVAHPGSFMLKRPTDVMQAISMAGGLTAFAEKNNIAILRRESDGSSTSLPFAYGKVEDGEQLESNILLQSGDTVVVP